MSCLRLSEEHCGELLDYSAGRLDAPARSAIEAHLRGCDDCVGFVSGQAALWSALEEWEAAPVSLDFNRRFWHRVETAPPAPWYVRLRESVRAGAWKPAFPLAAASMAIVAGFMFDHSGPMVPVANTVAASASVDAEQAESTLDDLQLLKQLDAAARPM